GGWERQGIRNVKDALALVISANIHRRHLAADQKRDVIANLIAAQPEKSNRQIAKQAKTSPTTVGTVRTEMEERGEEAKLDTRRDGRGVEQAAKKTKAKGEPTAEEAEASCQETERNSAEVLCLHRRQGRRDGGRRIRRGARRERDENGGEGILHETRKGF